jgi:hypothetical protein
MEHREQETLPLGEEFFNAVEMQANALLQNSNTHYSTA